jgi:hypothetical protein
LIVMPVLARQGDHRAPSGMTRGLLDIGSVMRQPSCEPQLLVRLATLPQRHLASWDWVLKILMAIRPEIAAVES